MPTYDFLFCNAYKVDALKAEKTLRSKYPLLLHENEKIELAFKDRGGKGRDKEYFTSHRILIKDGKGVGSKRKNYKSIPYETVLAFSVQTAGAVMNECDLVIWSSGIQRHSCSFSSKHVDIFEICQFLNTKVAYEKSSGTHDNITPKPPNMEKKQKTTNKIIDILGGNALQVDEKKVENIFKKEYPILLSDEKVEIAFKCGRDTYCFTDKRILFIDVKGITGKKVIFTTFLYHSIHGFSAETAGAYLDRDTKIELYTNIIDKGCISQDFRKGKADLFAIQKVLCNHILGGNNEHTKDLNRLQGHQDNDYGLLEFVSGRRFDQRPIDAVKMDHVLRFNPPILQEDESVEMAFQGFRDITVFTTKRLLTIDKKGLAGKKIKYFSVPWEKFLAFGARTAGMADFDTELLLYTEMKFYPGQSGDDDSASIPPRPEESCIEIKFNKNMVDLFKVQYYLSRKIINIPRLQHGAPIGLEAMTSASPEPQGLENFLQWLGGDQRELDPNEFDEKFRTNQRILLDDEKCLMAFKGGRDVNLFTNHRVLSIDVQGLTGRKVKYTSIPYRSIRAYSVESAGMWDRDSELSLYTRNRWDLAKVKMDFRAGKTDIMQVQKLLSGFILGQSSDTKILFGPKNYASHQGNTLGASSFVSIFEDGMKEIDNEQINAKFHFELPLLLEKEKVLRAFQLGRDIFLYTDRRIIDIDTKGLSGRRVRYKSIPYKHINGFEFETAGYLDNDAEVYMHTTVSKVVSESSERNVQPLVMKQSMLVKHTDVYEIGYLLLEHVILYKLSNEENPIIDSETNTASSLDDPYLLWDLSSEAELEGTIVTTSTSESH